MTYVATQVLTTVNGPYGTDLSAEELARMITDPKSATGFSAPVFAFFSEVPVAVQRQFLDGMGIDLAQATLVAGKLSLLSGYRLPLGV